MSGGEKFVLPDVAYCRTKCYLLLYWHGFAMWILKSKAFSKWAAKEGLGGNALCSAVDEMEAGLVDVDLGGSLFKKRVALRGRGKSSGVRTLLAYKTNHGAFFIYGFAKNSRSNISKEELKALKMYSEVLLSYSDEQLTKAVKDGALLEVNDE